MQTLNTSEYKQFKSPQTTPQAAISNSEVLKTKIKFEKKKHKNVNFHTHWLHYTHCSSQLIFSYTNTSLFILLNFIPNPFYTSLVLVFLNPSSFSLLISLPQTWSHSWEWHMASHENLTEPGECLQGDNSSPPALIAQCLPPRYCGWNLCSRAEPATPPRISSACWGAGSALPTGVSSPQ